MRNWTNFNENIWVNHQYDGSITVIEEVKEFEEELTSIFDHKKYNLLI